MQRFRVAGDKERAKIAAAFHTDIAHFESLINNFDKYEEEIIPPLEDSRLITDWMVDRAVDIGNVFGGVADAMTNVLIASFDALAKLLEDIADPAWAGRLRLVSALANPFA